VVVGLCYVAGSHIVKVAKGGFEALAKHWRLATLGALGGAIVLLILSTTTAAGGASRAGLQKRHRCAAFV
jgi:hypothetical protein